MLEGVTLSPRDVMLVRAWYDDRPEAEIAAELGVKRQRVGQLYAALRARGIPLDASARRKSERCWATRRASHG